MTAMPESVFGDQDKSLYMRRGSLVGLNVELDTGLDAKELFQALVYILNEKVTLDLVHREGTTVALRMTIKPEWEGPGAEAGEEEEG